MHDFVIEVVRAVVVEQVRSALEHGDGLVPCESALVEDAVDVGHVEMDMLREMLTVVVLGIAEDMVGNAGK